MQPCALSSLLPLTRIHHLGLEHEPAQSQSLLTIFDMIDYDSNKVFTEAAMCSVEVL